MTVAALLLDVDDTMVDFGGAALAGILDLWGPDPGREPAEIQGIWAAESERHYSRFTSGELGFTEMQHARLADFLQRAGRPVPDAAGLDALERRRQQVMTEHYRLFDDVLPCLAAARADGLALGVVSNSDGAHQRAKLAAVGLSDAFDVVIISGEVGVSKPNPAIFDMAVAALDVPAADVMYVGDRYDVDAAAAVSAGLQGIWLDRLHSNVSADVPVVRALADLPDLWRSASMASAGRR